MNNIFTLTLGYIKSRINSILYTPDTRPEKYAGKKKISFQEANDFIYSHLQSDRPFMVGRYGSIELLISYKQIVQNWGYLEEFKDRELQTFCNNAGFFPKNQKLASKFGNLMIEKSAQADLLALYYSTMEEYFIKNYAPQATLVRGRGIEPWYVENPWTRGLAGKKVLVIHPFESTILKQYKKRDLLFPGTNILPEFELKTLKAVQTIAGEKDERFKDWFEALDYMYNEAMKIDFDVAIIGCGAYGFPLAAMLKEAGKQAIHLGGATQYIFGIKSKRADVGNALITGLYNDAWVRPSDDERPKNYKSVEGGCYW